VTLDPVAPIDVGLVTTDLGRALAFYHEVLGLALGPRLELDDGSVIASVHCGGSRLKLYQPVPAPTAAAPGGGHRAATGWRYVTIHVTDAAALHRRLDAAGVTIPVPLRTSPQRRTFFVQDPDGNNVELVETRHEG
jgi:catechol 2,3-dioxygenase-like lactoylglutathione lyase family enzyme